jgi:hypothetical protein
MSHQLWNTLIKWKLSPNQIYFMDCCRSNIKPNNIIDEEIEKQICLQRNLIDAEGNLTNEGAVILNEFETHLVKTKKKVATEVLGTDVNERIKEYREIWPAKRLPSGELARQSNQELKDKFVWFFKTYPEYDWDLILDATDYYNEVFKRKNYQYMVSSSYFIKKTNPQTKEVSSKLADYCQEILDNPNMLNSNT